MDRASEQGLNTRLVMALVPNDKVTRSPARPEGRGLVPSGWGWTPQASSLLSSELPSVPPRPSTLSGRAQSLLQPLGSSPDCPESPRTRASVRLRRTERCCAWPGRLLQLSPKWLLVTRLVLSLRNYLFHVPAGQSSAPTQASTHLSSHCPTGQGSPAFPQLSMCHDPSRCQAFAQLVHSPWFSFLHLLTTHPEAPTLRLPWFLSLELTPP